MNAEGSAEIPTVVVTRPRCPTCGSDRYTTKGGSSRRIKRTDIRERRVTCKGLKRGNQVIPCGAKYIILAQ